ncbi:MAG: hypothetical protein V1717_02985 [Candidatus Micrarchaeota archaeon]
MFGVHLNVPRAVFEGKGHTIFVQYPKTERGRIKELDVDLPGKGRVGVYLDLPKHLVDLILTNPEEPVPGSDKFVLIDREKPFSKAMVLGEAVSALEKALEHKSLAGHADSELIKLHGSHLLRVLQAHLKRIKPR